MHNEHFVRLVAEQMVALQHFEIFCDIVHRAFLLLMLLLLIQILYALPLFVYAQNELDLVIVGIDVFWRFAVQEPIQCRVLDIPI